MSSGENETPGHRGDATSSGLIAWFRNRYGSYMESTLPPAAEEFYSWLLGSPRTSQPDLVAEACRWHYKHLKLRFRELAWFETIVISDKRGRTISPQDFEDAIFSILLDLSDDTTEDGVTREKDAYYIRTISRGREFLSQLSPQSRAKALVIASDCLDCGHEFLKSPFSLESEQTRKLNGTRGPSTTNESSRNGSLLVPYVSYYTLHTVLGVRIRWTDELSEHLNFEEKTNVLSIFRYPSLCVLIARGNLGRLITPAGVRPQRSVGLERQFASEVLRSYRLLFGQKPSQVAYRRNASRSLNVSERNISYDPLLDALCRSNSSNSKIDEIVNFSSENTADYYPDILEQYPNLASRLSILQSFSEAQNPSSIAALWRDHWNIRDWLNLWVVFFIAALTALFNPIPASMYSVEVTLIISPALALCIFILNSKSPQAIFRTRRKRLPTGSSSIAWTCVCGAKLHDDFIELKEGAVRQYEKNLQDLSTQRSGDHHDIESDSQGPPEDSDSSRSPLSWFSQYRVTFGGVFPHRAHRCDEEGNKYQIPNESINTSNDPVYLLVCIDNGRQGPRLAQIDIRDCCSDGNLFTLLRNTRLQLLGTWRPCLSFRTLRTIKFVQFELFFSGDVDVRPYDDTRMLPHGDRAKEYSYSPCPPELLPPLGEQRLLHLWEYPDHPDHSYSICISRFPKRPQERLHVDQNGACVGWGIQLVEGFHWKLLWLVMFIIFGIGGLVFSITFAVLEDDIQSAFSISTYFISVATLFVAVCSRCWL